MHRIPAEDVLEHPTRQRLHDLIRERPGIRTGTLATLLGLDYRTVSWHVAHLRRARLVLREHAGDSAQARWFPVLPGWDGARRRQALALASPCAEAIFAFVRANGPADMPAIRSSLGLAASSVSQHVGALAEAGLVSTRRERRRVVVAARNPPLVAGVAGIQGARMSGPGDTLPQEESPVPA